MFSFSGKNIKDSLARTRKSVFGQITTLLGAGEIDDEFWDDLEALLIQADIGVETTLALIEVLRQRVTREGLTKPVEARDVLKEEMQKLLDGFGPSPADQRRILTVILVVGVNGSGKTTSIAKLATYYQKQGRQVILGAADTFRAAAIDQLKIWGERANVPVIAHQPKADPGAVVFDTLKSALARKADMVIIDTAGRLHTKFNLMKELEKLRNIARKQVHAAPHETLLVLDASTGQNALAQAKHFKDSVDITGVVLAKLDGTAKGGMVFAIGKELGVPVRFIGTGEKIEDLAPFDPKGFVDGLFEA
ncbi:MAG TPA: signal recognition particle-docking protein FtsY [Anaerolineae bacterium]